MLTNQDSGGVEAIGVRNQWAEQECVTPSLSAYLYKYKHATEHLHSFHAVILFRFCRGLYTTF